MRLNRRSVLLGLGTISATVGGAFGSGAFSTVEATRTVNVQTSDDSDALLSFEANKLGTTGGGTPEDNNGIIFTETPENSDTSVIKIEQTDLNENATTTFNNALKVSNKSNKDIGISVDSDKTEYVDDTTDSLVGGALDIENADGNSIVGSAVDLDASNESSDADEITLTVVVDLQSNTGADIDDIESIVFAARQSDHSSSQ